MRSLLFPVLLLSLPLAPASASEPSAMPDDLGKWGLHCFCIEAVATPHRIIRMDDNGKILRRSINGTTVSKLRAEGLLANDSQLLLLRLFGLIDRDGDKIRTAIPVLDASAMTHLRAKSAALGKRIANEVKPQVKAIRAELERRKLGASDYAVVFGYALDAVLWDHPLVKARLPETSLTVKQPYWRGAFWAMYPERNGSAGRNEIGEGATKLVMVWSDPVVNRLNDFAKSDQAKAMLKEVEANPTKGRSDFPVIHDRRGDRLHDLSLEIADAVARGLIQSAEGRAVLGAVPKANESEAMLIIAHELIWDVADELVAQKQIHYPDVLGQRAATAPLAPLLYARVGSGK